MELQESVPHSIIEAARAPNVFDERQGRGLPLQLLFLEHCKWTTTICEPKLLHSSAVLENMKPRAANSGESARCAERIVSVGERALRD